MLVEWIRGPIVIWPMLMHKSEDWLSYLYKSLFIYLAAIVLIGFDKLDKVKKHAYSYIIS